jgi:hypothetical protein
MTTLTEDRRIQIEPYRRLRARLENAWHLDIGQRLLHPAA